MRRWQQRKGLRRKKEVSQCCITLWRKRRSEGFARLLGYLCLYLAQSTPWVSTRNLQGHFLVNGSTYPRPQSPSLYACCLLIADPAHPIYQSSATVYPAALARRPPASTDRKAEVRHNDAGRPRMKSLQSALASLRCEPVYFHRRKGGQDFFFVQD